MNQDNGTAIVFVLSVTGLSVARSLAHNGVTVYGVDAHRYEVGHFAREVRREKSFAFLREGDELLARLIEFGKRFDRKPVIFNAGDPYIEFVADNRAELEQYYILTDSMRPEMNNMLLDKRTFYQACEKMGVDMPTTYFPETEAEVIAAAKEIRYPAIVKPNHGFKVRKILAGAKLVEVAGREELLDWWRKLNEWGTGSVIQECIPGPEYNIAVGGLYMDRQHNCTSIFTAKKYRQYPPMYGSASYIEAKWMPEIADMSIELMKRFDYHGVCGTEYKWDERDLKWKLIEVNCRPTQWFSITREAGVDVVWDAYCDLIGKPNPAKYGQQDDTVRWQIFVRDIVSSLHFLKRGELSFPEFWRTTIDQRKKAWAVASASDWGVNYGYIVNTFMQIYLNFIKKGE
jgi:predicted ATP-grasp superfamily ATP-dependent carboligase